MRPPRACPPPRAAPCPSTTALRPASPSAPGAPSSRASFAPPAHRTPFSRPPPPVARRRPLTPPGSVRRSARRGRADAGLQELEGIFRRLFTTIDLDGDGKVSKGEWLNAMARLPQAEARVIADAELPGLRDVVGRLSAQ